MFEILEGVEDMSGPQSGECGTAACWKVSSSGARMGIGAWVWFGVR